MKIRLIICLLLALSLMLFAAACRKKTPKDLMDEAAQALQRGDYIGATIKAEDIIKKHPDAPESMDARFLLAVAQESNGDLEGARQTFTEIIQKAGMKSDIAKAAYMRRLYTYRQKPEQAISQIQQTSSTLKSDPQFAGLVQKQLGNLYIMTKQPEKAKSHFRLMMQNAPTEPEAVSAMEDLVRVLVEEKKPQEALAVYQNHLERFPKSEMKGSYLFGIGVMHKQIADAAKDPQVKASEMQAAEKSFAESEAFIQQQIQSEPLERRKNAHIMQLSKVYRGKGDKKKSEELLVSTLNKTKNKDSQLDILGELIRANDEEQNLPGIRRWLEQVTKRFPGTEHAQAAIQGIRQIDQMLKQRAGATTGTLKQAPVAGVQPTTATKSPESPIGGSKE